MAVAKRPGGLYYVGQTAVDSEGKTIPDAPEREPDTAPSSQVGNPLGPSHDERIAAAVAGAVGPAVATAVAEVLASKGKKGKGEKPESETDA